MSRSSKRKQRRRRQLKKEALAAQVPQQDITSRARDLIERCELDAAQSALEAHLTRHADDLPVVYLLLDVYQQLSNHFQRGRLAWRLVELEPDNPAAYLQLADACLECGEQLGAYRAFQACLSRFPDHPLCEGVEQQLRNMEASVRDELQRLGLDATRDLELAVGSEQVKSALKHGQFADAFAIGQELLNRFPDNVDVKNELAIANFLTGQHAQAVELTREVLAREADNVRANTNLARFLTLSGQPAEASALIPQLRSLPLRDDAACLLLAKTCSLLGDDQGVLAVMDHATREKMTGQNAHITAQLKHFAAVATARQGNWDAAVELWNQALELEPSFDLARNNRDNALTPICNREAPWPFPITGWIHDDTLDELLRTVPTGHNASDRQRKRAVNQFLARHSQLRKLIPSLLDRGDPTGQMLARNIAALIGTSEMYEALRAYCLSTRGPDDRRMEIVNLLHDMNELPSEEIRVFVDGDWKTIRVFNADITYEPLGNRHSEEVEKLLMDALDALREEDGVTAEQLLNTAIELGTPTRDLLQNLATAYQVQGRLEKWKQLQRSIHEQWPDYFFGKIGMALVAMEDEQFDKASEILASLQNKKRFHIDEITAYCGAYVQLYSQLGDLEGMQHWYDVLTRIQNHDVSEVSVIDSP